MCGRVVVWEGGEKEESSSTRVVNWARVIGLVVLCVNSERPGYEHNSGFGER